MIRFYNIPLDFSDNVTIIYDEDTELIAFTLERSLISLRETFVKSVSVYEFSFLENPYSGNFKDVIIVVNDENKSRTILDNTWALQNRGFLLTCNDKIKSKGDVKVLNFQGELCEVSLSLSLLRKVAYQGNNIRAKDIIKELDSLSTIDNWLLTKLNDIDFNADLFLSPVFYPAITLMSKILNKNIHKYFEIPEGKKVVFLTTGVDSIIVRKREFEMRNSNLDVKEVIVDIDPLLAPIYLILMTYLFKRVNGG